MVRGYRMTEYPSANKIILPPYSEELIKDTIFTNYAVLGWVIFTLVGIGGFATIIAIRYRAKHYAYLVIVQSIFLFFFALINIIFSGFTILHVFVILFCIAVLTLGVLQTSKDLGGVKHPESY